MPKKILRSEHHFELKKIKHEIKGSLEVISQEERLLYFDNKIYNSRSKACLNSLKEIIYNATESLSRKVLTCIAY